MRSALRLILLVIGGLLWGSGRMACAQVTEKDSLKRRLIGQPADTNRVRLLNQLSHFYLDDKPGQAQGLGMMGSSLSSLGDYLAAIRFFQQSLQISRSINDLTAIYKGLNNMAVPYQEQKDYKRSLRLTQEAYRVLEQRLSGVAGRLGRTNHRQRCSNQLLNRQKTEIYRQPTDLNALADEYVRLAYHGLRRSEGRLPGDPTDKDGLTGIAPAHRPERGRFNCELVTDLDPDQEPVPVVPADMGRVLLNLFNNAFYAVQQKSNSPLAPAGYPPTVWLRTRREAERVCIEVRDNGTGMPESVQARIFQPFFTTKPTGEGTGLGLSLRYDMVTKGHDGTLSVVSEPGQFTRMQITLPLHPIHQPA